jgi:magnesium chelatase family protein
MLARALAGLLPDLEPHEALEVAALYSLRGRLADRPPTSLRPPFRAPHHSISRAGLVGGGAGLAQPGEISLAHRGVLLLDEICEFSRAHLEALRQPLEERRVTVTRVRGSVVFPADFMLVAAANPCPCGRLGQGQPQACSCAEQAVVRYQGRLSGPMRDRLDMVVDVPRLDGGSLLAGSGEEPTATVRGRVAQAQALQRSRVEWTGVPANAQLAGERLLEVCGLDSSARDALTVAGERWQLSARAYHRVLRVGRTIADLRGDARVGRDAVIEAFQLRGHTA